MFSFRSKKSYPIFYQRYLEKIQDVGFTSDMIALDMETSGMDKKTADVLSFGAVPIRSDKIVLGESIHHFFESSETNNDAIIIHELLPDLSDNKFSNFLEPILALIENHIILGHFIGFDISFINRELARHKLPKLKNPTLDTLSLALKKDRVQDLNYVKREDYSLYALCKRYGITVEQTHDAMEDAYLSALLYLTIR